MKRWFFLLGFLACSAYAQQAATPVVTTTTTTSNRPGLAAAAPPAAFQPPAPLTSAQAPATVVSTTVTTPTTAPMQAAAAAMPAPSAPAPAAVAPPPASAAPATSANFTQSPAYQECTRLAASNPLAAEEKAAAWLRMDDGVAAHHCRAMALYGQRRFAEAAQELEVARGRIDPQNMALRCYAARQGAKAWVDAGRPDAAIALYGTQINELAQARGDNAAESKLTSELLLDRAQLRVTYGQLPEAVQDLDHAVSLTPANEDVLMARANAFQQLNDIPLAKQDLALVMRLNPANPKALALKQKLESLTAPAPASPTLKPLQ